MKKVNLNLARRIRLQNTVKNIAKIIMISKKESKMREKIAQMDLTLNKMKKKRINKRQLNRKQNSAP